MKLLLLFLCISCITYAQAGSSFKITKRQQPHEVIAIVGMLEAADGDIEYVALQVNYKNLLKIDSNGDLFLRDKKVGNDIEIYNAAKSFYKEPKTSLPLLKK